MRVGDKIALELAEDLGGEMKIRIMISSVLGSSMRKLRSTNRGSMNRISTSTHTNVLS